jgi:hypothetical protein
VLVVVRVVVLVLVARARARARGDPAPLAPRRLHALAAVPQPQHHQHADVSQREMSQATSMASVAQQLAASTGVTVGACVLQLSMFVRGGAALAVTDFHVAFVDRGDLAHVEPVVRRLPADAGAELAGRPSA